MENIVIGSGPAGRLAAVELGKLGKEVLLIEKKHITGTCLNEGCMVICALNDIAKFIESNNLFNKHGFVESSLKISYDKITEKIIETQEKLRKINEMENNSYGNTLVYGEAKLEGDSVIVNGESYEYKKLLIATGGRPFIPNIKGAEYGLTNQDILKIDKIPEKLNIIGGEVLSCEIGNIYSILGSEVNIFARKEFLKEIDQDMKDYIVKKIIPKVNIHENTAIITIKKNKIITRNNEEYEGKTFLATGRVPNSEIVKDKVELNPDKTIKVNEMMETTQKNIFAAGDVVGGKNLTPVARMEGIVAGRNMAGYLNKIDYSLIPESISLNMEVGFVGNDNINKEDKLVNIKTPGIAGPGVFWNILSGTTGSTKITFNKTKNKIEKITAISPSSVSDIAYLSYLMRTKQDLDEFEEFLEIHPSTDSNYKIIKSMWL